MDSSELGDAELVARLAALEGERRLRDAEAVRLAGVLAERSRPELGSESLARRYGARSAGQLLERITLISSAEAARRIRLAADTTPRVSLVGEVLPARFDLVAQALEAGELGVDSALAIVRNLGAAERRAPIDKLQTAECALVDEGRTKSADLVAVEARVWRAALDADGAEPTDRELRESRRFVIGREQANGMTPFWGEADPVSAAELRTWLGARTAPNVQPRFLPDDEADTDLPDPRTRDQRTFDVIMGLLHAGVRAEALSTTPVSGAANVMVVVREDVLERGTGTAWISDVTEPISAASAATLACESGIQKILLGPLGQPLALGRRERYFSSSQRKALAVRDGGCAWPECTAPPPWTHAHHVVPWSQAGTTDVENGVLLCPFHHHLVHDGEFEIRMFEGIPHLRAPRRLDLEQTWRRMGRRRVALAA